MSAVADNKTDKVIHLRSLLQERFPEAHHRVAPPSPTDSSSNAPAQTAPAPVHTPESPLGLAVLDALDDGRGLAPGAFVEIVSRRRGGGIGALIGGLIQAAATAERRYPLALIDGADSFDPISLSDSPATAAALCQQLLWVRCRHRIDHAIKTADLLLRDGNLPLVMLDLQLCRPREVRRGVPGGTSAWYRLRSLGEKTGTTFLAFTTEPIVPGTPWRLELDHTWPLDALDRLPDTGDLRREPIRHTLSRARPTTTSVEPDQEQESKEIARFAIAS